MSILSRVPLKILTLFSCISSFSFSLSFWRSFRHSLFVVPLLLLRRYKQIYTIQCKIKMNVYYIMFSFILHYLPIFLLFLLCLFGGAFVILTLWSLQFYFVMITFHLNITTSKYTIQCKIKMNVYYITFPFILTLFTCISSFSSSSFSFWRSFHHSHLHHV